MLSLMGTKVTWFGATVTVWVAMCIQVPISRCGPASLTTMPAPCDGVRASEALHRTVRGAVRDGLNTATTSLTDWPGATAKLSGSAPASGDSGGAAAADHNGSAAASAQRYSRGLMLKVQCPSFQAGQD